MCRKSPRILSGSVLAYAIVVMAAVSMLFLSITTFITSQIRNAAHEEASEQAFQIAESGVHFYKWYLAHQTTGKDAAMIEDFWESGSPYGVDAPYEAEYSDPSGGPAGRYRITVTPPDPGSTIAWVESEGWSYKYPDHIRKVRARLRRPSWSENAVLANAFVRFGEGTEVYGKIMSNQGVRFDGLAHNIVMGGVWETDDPDHCEIPWRWDNVLKVWVCDFSRNEFGVHTHVNAPPANGTNDSFRADEAPPLTAAPERPDIFMAGREFPVESTDFNGVSGSLSLMLDESQSGNGIYFGNQTDFGRRIILRSDGTFDTCRVKTLDTDTHMPVSYRRNSGSTGSCSTCGSNICTQNYPIPQNGVIFVEDDVWLSGTVNGRKVTIAAANMTTTSPSRSVYIPNDIRYTDYDGSDIIGVVGQGDISIPRDSESDLRIDAALLAQLGRVGRPNYGTSDHKSVITIFGMIATNQRYGFAWTNGTSDWGYDTRNLYYDNNLLYYPPPYFPTGTQYFIDLWEEL